MSASVVAATVIAIFLTVGGDTEQQMPRFTSDGEIHEDQCGMMQRCDFDDGSPECFVERSRGKWCSRNMERVRRMELMEPRDTLMDRSLKPLSRPEWMPADQPMADGQWIKLQL